jgi:murein L,D-transpeptidase YcbB/YkuD
MTLKTKHILVALLFHALLFSACSNDTPKKDSEIPEIFDPSFLKEFIQNTLTEHKNDTGYIHYYDTLFDYYALRKYEPIWYKELNEVSFWNELKNITDSIIYEGLKPEHYFYDSLEIIHGMLKNASVKQQYELYAKADVLVSNLLAGIWHDKVLGRTNPKEVLGMKYTLPYPNHPNFDLFAVLNKTNGRQKLLDYHPQDPDFWLLKSLLKDAYVVTEGSETFIDTTGIRKLKVGDTSYIIPLLALRLVELGYLEDSLLTQYEHINIYPRALSDIVKSIQKESNLTDDGIIGKSTLKLLNASRNDRIDEIRANLERLRWFGVEPPKPYVKVNIPEFMLYMYYPDSVRSLTVCIGKGKEKYYDQKKKKYVVSKRYYDKPQNHETPQIYSNIDYIVLNPTWTVPSSIVGREMYGMLVRDPNYLTKNNYKVFKNGKEVDPKTINWRSYGPNNIPFTIRQNAGDDNSLGKIKFTFKNPFDVYMHDTPLKSKFKLNNRAVSHGCVRVQSPIELTEFVLKENTKKTFDDVLIMMGKEPKDSLRAAQWRDDTGSYRKVVTKTLPIRLENKMTVFFDYRTIVFNQSGYPRFINDVYDKNKMIIEALNRR